MQLDQIADIGQAGEFDQRQSGAGCAKQQDQAIGPRGSLWQFKKSSEMQRGGDGKNAVRGKS